MAAGLLCYFLTSVVAILGVLFGCYFVAFPSGYPRAGSDLVEAFLAQDGLWYKEIATVGYSYNRTARSSIAFFPAYPTLAAVLVCVTGLDPDVALLVVSHCCLIAAFLLAATYIGYRYPQAPLKLGGWVLLSMGLMPATLFFRMGYSESLFVLLTILTLFAMERLWPLSLIAMVIGLATATRPVGVGLLLPFLLHCRHRTATWREFVWTALNFLPIACWGIGAYLLYQEVYFQEPFAFVKTQAHWGRWPVSFSDKLIALLTGKPIWSVYNPASPGYWGLEEPPCLLFNWAALNPVYFTATAVLVVVGVCRSWLSSYETLLAAALLAIPYLTRSYEMNMASGARFAAVVFPVYLVLGNLLIRVPGALATAFLGFSSFYLGAFSALFAVRDFVY